MKMLIDSQWVEASDGSWQEIRNPGTGDVIDKVPVATLQDAETALQAAQRGKEAMGKLPAHKRSAILFRIAEAMEARPLPFRLMCWTKSPCWLQLNESPKSLAT